MKSPKNHNDTKVSDIDLANYVNPDLDMRSPIFTEEYQKRMKEAVYYRYEDNDASFFKRAWRFISGKNKAGKSFHRILVSSLPVVGAVLGVETGLLTDIIPLTTNGDQTMITAIELFGLDIGWVEILGLLATVILFITTHLITKARAIGEQLAKILKLVAAAIDKGGPKGSKLSDNEKDQILAEFAILAKIIWNGYAKSWVNRKLFNMKGVTEEEAKKLE